MPPLLLKVQQGIEPFLLNSGNTHPQSGDLFKPERPEVDSNPNRLMCLLQISFIGPILGREPEMAHIKGRHKERREKAAALLTGLSWIPFNTFHNELIKAFFPAERLKVLFKNWHPPSTFMSSLIKILAKSHITHTSTSNSIR